MSCLKRAKFKEVTLISVIFIIIIDGITCAVNDEIVRSLLSEYEIDRRPPPENNATEIRIGFSVKFTQVDPAANIVMLLGRMQMKWIDTRLKFDESDIGTPEVFLSSDTIWKPQLTLLNAVEAGSFVRFDEGNIVIGSNGTVIWEPKVKFTVPCDIALEKMTLSQHCMFQFSSLDQSIDEIRLTYDRYDKSYQLQEEETWGDWQTKDFTSTATVSTVSLEQYSLLTWYVTLTRVKIAQDFAGQMIAKSLIFMFLGASLADLKERFVILSSLVLASIAWTLGSVLNINSILTPNLILLHICLIVSSSIAIVLSLLLTSLSKMNFILPAFLQRILHKLLFKNNDSSTKITWAYFVSLIDMVFMFIISLILIILMFVYS